VIDFRYHLVSIVSIFLALAVGIALGAGPLKGQLGDQLEGQIKSLTSEKSSLNGQLSDARKAADARDSFITAENKQLLAGRLGGATVALVVLPGADGAVVKATTQTVAAAGAKIGATVTVKSSWSDKANADHRAQAATTAQRALGIQPATPAGGQAVDGLLAAALVGTSEATSDLARRSAALKVLGDAKLLSVDTDQLTAVATCAVVISGPVTDGTNAQNLAVAKEYVALAAALDAGSKGAVLASNVGVDVPTSGVSVVSTARANSDLKATLSTVDDAGISMGQASIVLGLAEQERGGAGQYGLGADAGAAFPVLQGG